MLWLRNNLSSNVLSYAAFAAALRIFFGVDQVRNVWYQRPPIEGGFWMMAGYVVFLLFLFGYTLSSFFVVLRHFPIKAAQRGVRCWLSWARQARLQYGWRRWLHPGFWLAALPRLLDWTAGLLVAFAAQLDGWLFLAFGLGWLLSAFRLGGWFLSVLGLGGWFSPAFGIEGGFLTGFGLGSATLLLLVLVFGFRRAALLPAFVLGGCLPPAAAPLGGSGLGYPLSSVFLHSLGLLVLLTGIWLVLRPGTPPRPVSNDWGRFLAWVLTSCLLGELIWRLASAERIGVYLSYRFYTIWAVLYLLTAFILLGNLVDRWHQNWSWAPVRPLALVVVAWAAWAFTHAVRLPLDDVRLHMTGEQQAFWDKGRDQGEDVPQRNLYWFEHLRHRIAAIPPEGGPAVIVAASGGGSRAAIFTALSLETLAHTPLDAAKPVFDEPPKNDPPRTWADNIVLISSVSGGSLATAYFVERLPHNPDHLHGLPPRHPGEPRTVEELRNTTAAELVARLREKARELLLASPVQVQPGAAEEDPWFRETCLPGLDPQQSTDDDLRDYLLSCRRRDSWADLREKLRQQRANLHGQQKDQLDVRIEVLNQLLAITQVYLFLHKPAELKDAELQRFRWAFHSRAFDEMCADFMASITRGALSPTLDRGDSLALFWTQRFGWQNCTSFNGYGDFVRVRDYHDFHPAVVFNASDVAKGSRLAVGFPALPHDLWQAAYPERKLARERPKTLDELDGNHSYRVSLARAVRMSSNFPFGFRVLELDLQQPPDTNNHQAPVHVLDGGVVDNTGLDTVCELFRAVAFHAYPANSASPYHQPAKEILTELRRRGVVLFEIDAGAKPDERTPILFSGVREPIQALNNATYTSADQVKAFYLRETRAILNRKLDALTEGDKRKQDAVASFRAALPATTLHLPFQCNHYHPGAARAGEDVMTAWTLGPDDKATVVLRFLVELALWDLRRADVQDDFLASCREFDRTVIAAGKAIVLARLTDLGRQYADLFKDIREGRVQTEEQMRQVKARLDTLRKQYAALAREVAGLGDKDLDSALALLSAQVKDVEESLGKLAEARTAPERQKAGADLKTSTGRADATLGAVQDKVGVFNQSMMRGFALPNEDPQRRIDIGAKITQQVYEKPPAPK